MHLSVKSVSVCVVGEEVGEGGRGVISANFCSVCKFPCQKHA